MAHGTHALFYALLGRFLHAFPWYTGTMVREPSTGEIQASHFLASTVPVSDDYSVRKHIYTDVMQVTRRMNDDIFDTDDAAFLYGKALLDWQQDSILWRELTLNLTLAAVGVVFISMLMLIHPVCLLVAVAVTVVDVCLFGVLYFYGMRFNSLSMICFVMAVGISVDYSLHVLHKFLSVPAGNANERMTTTLREMGLAILLSGVTTLLGLIPLAFAASKLFRTFCELLAATIIIGLCTGLLFIPILVAVLEPAPILSSLTQGDAGQGEHRGGPFKQPNAKNVMQGAVNDVRQMLVKPSLPKLPIALRRAPPPPPPRPPPRHSPHKPSQDEARLPKLMLK
ncbi:hypothetical protein CYMTET_19350 [Cymbomonas tetramitiformis]|uniref:SSD domain-containing protein n=1 Tax=Cymbomonas tetramitiformis TaxID=36881 RepID=A0AAE0G666_9CHLO|nr:hypothetical protein CYMTET_19350 [Cymbomonas tetramitiformis]